MKVTAPILEPEDNCLRAALHVLEEETGIAGHILEANVTVAARHEADAIIALSFDGRAYRYIVECKSIANRKSLISHLKTELAPLPEPVILVAPYVSREIATYCREIGLQFIDTHGNAYLNAPGMFVYVKGEKNEAGKVSMHSTRGTANPAALRVTFSLLCQPALVQAPYREIADRAGVSLGAVSGTFDDLKRRGLLLDAGRARQRKLIEPRRLFDEWVANYALVLRPKLRPRRFSAPDPDWWKRVHPVNLGAAWGGETAAERLTGYLKPETQTLYIAPASMDSSLKHLVSTHRLKPDPNGSIEILEKFWDLPEETQEHGIAPAILVYADLMTTFEPRNGEAAKMIWEARIEPALAKA